MARQPGPTAREIESSQLVDVIAKPSRVDDIAPDFSRLCTGQKPVVVFLNDFFSGTVPADLERIANQRGGRSTHLTDSPAITRITSDENDTN